MSSGAASRAARVLILGGGASEALLSQAQPVVQPPLSLPGPGVRSLPMAPEVLGVRS